MVLKDICKKLVKASINNYKILIFCLVMGTMLFTSYGLLIFSNTVTDVIVDGGSTQMIAYSIYVAFSLACLMFILYSHSLFMKYKSKEIGVFISLGINRKNIKDILLKELNYIIPIASVIGMLLAVPFTYVVWNFIKTIAGNINSNYEIGYLGFIGGILFSFITTKFVSLKTSTYIKNVDIMKILKSNDTIEDVKVSSYKFGIIGFFMIPIGIVGANFNMRGVLLDSIPFAKYIFFAMIVTGLYFVCASFTSLGEFVKKVNKKKYYKGIMFYNLLKLKGKQYTATLFTVTILMAITIFAMCFSFVNVLGKNEIAERLSPFDYSVLKSEEQNNLLTREIIENIATKNNVVIEEYSEIEILTVTKNFSQEEIDKYGVEVDPEFIVKESDYNKLYNNDIDVEQGMYYMVDSEKSKFGLERYKTMEISALGSENKHMMTKQGDIYQKLRNGEYGGLNFIVDDKDFEVIKSQGPSEALETNILFNVNNWGDSYEFYKELEEWIITNNSDGLLMYGTPFEKIYYDMEKEYVSIDEISRIDYRDWMYRLDSKIYMATDGIKVEIVYPLLFGYIALLAIIAAAMILYIKVLNTSWQDSVVYKNISLIGATKKTIKSIITKQLLIIFMLPTIVGLSLGVMIEIAMTSQDLTASIYRNYAVGFAIILALVQCIVFILARNVILKRAFKYEID